MKKVNAIFLGLAMLLTVGCGKDDDTSPVTPVNTDPAPENFTSCQLTRSKDDTLTSIYSYNAQGKIQQKSYAYGKEVFEYNTIGKVWKKFRLNSRLDTTSIEIFEYNNDSLPVKITTRNGLSTPGNIQVWGIYSLAYDSQKRLATRSSHDVNQPAIIINRVDYTYPAANKISIVTWELNRNTNTMQLFSEAELTHDNNKTPFGKDSPFTYLTANNELSFAIKFHIPFVYSHARTSTYTFNSAGYPTESITVTDGVYTNVSKYTYNCQ